MIVDCLTECFLDCEHDRDQILFPDQIAKGISTLGAFDCFPFLPVSLIQAVEAISEIVRKDQDKNIHVDPKDFETETKNVGIKGWRFVNILFLEKYVKAFRINTKNALPQAEKRHLEDLIHNLISDQDYSKAAKYIHCFNVHQDFDCGKLATTLVHRDTLK